jgi:RNA polymerase sigma factor (sigma-70 family)
MGVDPWAYSLRFRRRSGGNVIFSDDTDLGGQAVAFPATRCTLLSDAASADAAIRGQAQDAIISAYWKPVYKYIRFRWNAPNEDAKDLTQAFFARALEKNFFDGFDPAISRFRTFLRVCVDGFVANENRAAGRLKRGGAGKLQSLNFHDTEDELCHHPPAAGSAPDDFFRREWLRALFALAVGDLQRECAESGKSTHIAIFERYDLEGPDASDRGLTYAMLGQEFGLAETQVTNYLAFARRRFRHHLLERLRASAGSQQEYLDELRSLFGKGGP